MPSVSEVVAAFEADRNPRQIWPNVDPETINEAVRLHLQSDGSDTSTGSGDGVNSTDPGGSGTPTDSADMGSLVSDNRLAIGAAVLVGLLALSRL